MDVTVRALDHPGERAVGQMPERVALGLEVVQDRHPPRANPLRKRTRGRHVEQRIEAQLRNRGLIWRIPPQPNAPEAPLVGHHELSTVVHPQMNLQVARWPESGSVRDAQAAFRQRHAQSRSR